MTVSSRNRALSLGQTDLSHIPTYFLSIMLLLVMNLFISPASAQDLDPNLPPSGNFDLSYWKLTRPNNTERDENTLSNGYFVDGEFYTDSTTGAMVFWCPNHGRTTSNTSFPRTELREMIRRGDTSICLLYTSPSPRDS